jgi:hypothetical protein
MLKKKVFVKYSVLTYLLTYKHTFILTYLLTYLTDLPHSLTHSLTHSPPPPLVGCTAIQALASLITVTISYLFTSFSCCLFNFIFHMTNIILLAYIRLLSYEFFLMQLSLLASCLKPQPLFVWVITFDLLGMWGFTSSVNTTSIGLTIVWPHKPHHCDKVEIPSGEKLISLDTKLF